MANDDKTILVVDADAKQAELTMSAFRSADLSYPIHVVHSGQEALDYINGNGRYADRERFAFPRLVLLETRLTGLSAWDLLKAVYENPAFRNLPVIVFTESALPGDEEKAKDLGAFAYERKPADFGELIELVTKIATFWLLSRLPPPNNT